MAFRVVVEVADLTAQVTHENATVQIQYELANAAQLYTDYDTKNRMPKDWAVLSDVHATVVVKNIYNNVTLPDTKSVDTTLGKYDTATMLDTFIRAVSYNRVFTDAFTLDDAHQIDKDFYGNKGNIFAVTDIIGLTANKNLVDSFTMGDVFTKAIDYARVFADSFSFTDVASRDIQKGLKDTIYMVDHLLVDKDFYADKPDQFGVSDEAGFAFTKYKADSFPVSDQAVYAFGKTITGLDSISFTENVTVNRKSGRLMNGSVFNAATLN